MTGKPKPAPQRPAPRLYLATPVVDDPAALAAQLPDLLRDIDVAAVLIRLVPRDPRGMTEAAKILVRPVQAAGAAALLDGQVDLVARAGADGAHLTGVAALTAAAPQLKPDRIAGVGGLPSRHDAMTAGEAGADYVLFGEPDAQGRRPAPDAITERLQWWAELFEVPCVGFATTLAEAAAFAGAGADFILVGDLIWNDARGARTALVDARDAIGQNPDGTFGTITPAGGSGAQPGA
ncbi:MAG: thiamine phosphate synthase [Xanthobacteraceae bacterium]|nr:thiamine phosphate synthase [Xanthobacteraceae bacterium]